MEIDSLKLIPDASQTPEKLGYMGTADKQGSAYLRSALLAVCKHFHADPKTPFADLPKEVRDGFLNGVNGKLTFNQDSTPIRAIGRAHSRGFAID